MELIDGRQSRAHRVRADGVSKWELQKILGFTAVLLWTIGIIHCLCTAISIAIADTFDYVSFCLETFSDIFSLLMALHRNSP